MRSKLVAEISKLAAFIIELFQKNRNDKKLIILNLCFFLTILTINAQELKSDLQFAHLGNMKTKNTTIKLPIEIWNDLILVKAKFNNVEGLFVWDNGFYISGLDSQFIKDAKIQPLSASVEAKDANSKAVHFDKFLCNSFQINKIEIQETPIIQVDTKSIFKSVTKHIDGLIGASIINKLNWHFNFDKDYVEISTEPIILTQGINLPYEITESNKHLMPITINGINTQTLIDFGYNADDIAINIQAAGLFPKNKASEEYGITKMAVSGFSEIDTTYVIRKDYSYNLGGQSFNFLPKVSLAKSNDNIAIGNKFFRNNYNVIINCTTDTSYTLLTRKNPSTPQKDLSYGIKIFLNNGHLLVGKLTTNENNKNKTLHLLDEILEINGKSAAYFKDNFSVMNFQKQLLEKELTLKLKLKNGKVYSYRPIYDNEQ